MGIENIMYFVLGALAAGLLALMILPAIWRRAVRLTKKRIEAATPMSLAEFRADKDQLRAEFALSTRRLEMNVETLRKRLAEQLGDISRKKTDLSALKTDRDQHLAIVAELEERETDLRRRILELEKEGVDLAQRLRMRDRDYASKVSELESLREAVRGPLPAGTDLDGEALSGDYAEDVERLLTALAIERKRAGFLEEQAQSLIARLESSDRRTADTGAAIAELRRSMARREDAADHAASELVNAEARMASAENRLNALLEETRDVDDEDEPGSRRLLAEKFSLEDQVRQLREQVLGVEGAILSGWEDGQASPAQLRERLAEIASEVSRVVYAVDGAGAEPEQSLFDRVQKFADDGRAVEEITVRPAPARPAAARKSGNVSDRMAALRDLQGRR